MGDSGERIDWRFAATVEGFRCMQEILGRMDIYGLLLMLIVKDVRTNL